MKCPYCQNRPNMIKRTEGHDNWWECPQCHKTVGKKEEVENQEQEKNEAIDNNAGL